MDISTDIDSQLYAEMGFIHSVLVIYYLEKVYFSLESIWWPKLCDFHFFCILSTFPAVTVDVLASQEECHFYDP